MYTRGPCASLAHSLPSPSRSVRHRRWQCPAGCATGSRSPREPALAQHRTSEHRWARRRLRGGACSRAAGRDLCRDRQRRRVQEHEPGHVVDADFRPRRGDDVDRRRRSRPVGREYHLGRHGRSEQPSELVLGRRDLQVIDAGRTWNSAVSPTPDISPASSFIRRTPTSCTWQPPATCGDRTAARRFQDRRRRTDLDQGPVRR